MSLETLQAIEFPTRIGGHIALDFTNTAEHRGSEQFQDSLLTYDHWLAWCWRSNLLSNAEADLHYQVSAQRPPLARQSHLRAIKLREALHEIFSAVINDLGWWTIDLSALNEVLREGYGHRQVANTDAGFSWVWDGATDDMSQPLWKLAHAAAELLTSEQLSRVRQCPNCGWLFIDASRNGMRRWCSMNYCGSQVKSRRQYERKKAIGN
jgi:predicted RNA-binding Zn ribbon-like protein